MSKSKCNIIPVLVGKFRINFSSSIHFIFCMSCYIAMLYSIQSQVKGVVLLEHTPTSAQYLVEVQEQFIVELGLTCIPVKSPAEAAKIIKAMVTKSCYVDYISTIDNQSTSGDAQENQFLQRGGHGTVDPHLLQAALQLPNTGKVKATALLEKFGSEDCL